MPYRRLPNTDVSRISTLKAAYEKSQKVDFNEIAFGRDKVFEIILLVKKFESLVSDNRESLKLKNNSSKVNNESYSIAKMYVNHFIQVFNMSIERGEISPAIKLAYKLPKSNIVPKYKTEKEFIALTKGIIEGEKSRTASGGTPIMNPSIAMVKVKFDMFHDTFMKSQTAKKSSKRVQDDIIHMRKKIDAFIKVLWNDIEDNLRERYEEWREEATKYGISYVYRPYEQKMKNLESPELSKSV